MLLRLLQAKAKRAVQDSLVFALPKVRVRVNQGVVRGCIEKLPDGRSFQRFLGVPYAKPPVNELRFRSPQKLLQFDQPEVDCTREGPASFHKSGFHQKYVGSEDCLNLNVFVPSSAGPMNKLPVMVFCHGGGLVFDSNSRDFYSPEFLLMEDVIVVTINYRLHALGFLSLPDVGISGNAGLKDQQMALEWVHENISSFNGDPDKICFFGESAGAACVHLHAMNKKSQKHFRSAISQSNYAFADWILNKDGEDSSRRLAKLLGSKGNTDKDHLEVLMKAPLQQLYDLNPKAVSSNADSLRRNLPFVFRVVVERESEDAFLSKTPLELLKSSDVKIPMIFGLNDGDGMTMANFYRNKKLPWFENDPVRMVPLSLNIDPNSEEAKKVGLEVKKFYFGDKPINGEVLAEFVKLMTDFQFAIPQTMSNELHARHHPNMKQFVYEFCYDGELNMFKQLLKMTKFSGACHFDEIFYLFHSRFVGMNVAEDSPAGRVRRTMCKLWTNFAKFGDPTPDGHNPLSQKWEPLHDDPENLRIKYLKINEKPEMQEDLYTDHMDFWRNVYKKYNSGLSNPKF